MFYKIKKYEKDSWHGSYLKYGREFTTNPDSNRKIRMFIHLPCTHLRRYYNISIVVPGYKTSFVLVWEKVHCHHAEPAGPHGLAATTPAGSSCTGWQECTLAHLGGRLPLARLSLAGFFSGDCQYDGHLDDLWNMIGTGRFCACH